MPFRDRAEAGKRLATRLGDLGLESPVVLGLAHGGLPVAAQVAAGLGVSFDVFVARKIGTPGHEELGIGAVAEGLDEPVVSRKAQQVGVGPEHLRALSEVAHAELDRRVGLYRGNRQLPELNGRDIVLVDDGLATGVTAEAALRALRLGHPRRLVLAVGVGTPEAVDSFGELADEVICADSPTRFSAVGQWYTNFSETTDGEVLELLDRRTAASHKR